MIAGSLEIQLLANMARLQKDMDDAKRVVGGAMGEIDRMAGVAMKALGALGGVLSVGMLVGFVKGAIDAADGLNDLRKSTGLTVETLAGLKLASKQSGAELQGTADAINKLSRNIGENAEKYAKIGVTAKEPLEAFKQLADVFSKIEDPQKRAALAAEALGRGWASAGPLLAEGGDNIQKMVDKGTALSGVTQDAADKADKFNDQLAELQTVVGGVGMAIANEVLPTLIRFSTELLEGTKAAGGFWNALLMGASINPFKDTGQNLAAVRGDLAEIEADLKEYGYLDEQRFNRKKAQLEYLKAMQRNEALKLGDGSYSNEGRQRSTEKLTAAREASIAAFIKTEKAAKATTGAYDALIARSEHMASLFKQAAVELDEIAKANADYGKAVDALLGPIESEAASLEREVEIYGQTRQQIELTTIARIEEALAIAKANGANADAITFYEKEIEARKRIAAAAGSLEGMKASETAAKKSADDWAKTAESIERSLTDALLRGFESGKGFAENLRDTVVNMFKTMVLRPIIQATVQGGMGALGLGGAGNALASGGGGMQGVGGLLSQFGSGSMSLANVAGSMYGNVTGTGIDGLLATNGAYGTAAPSFMSQAGDFAANYGGYISAGIQLLQGNIKGAAFTAAGTAIGNLIVPGIGGIVGSVLGSVLGSFFGKSGERFPRTVSSALGSYSDGQYTSGGIDATYKGKQFGKDADKGMDGLVNAFTTRIGSLLAAFDLDDSVKARAAIRLRRTSGKLATDFHADVGDGMEAMFVGQFGKNAKDIEKSIAEFVNSVMSVGIQKAVAVSKLPDLIKEMFAPLDGTAQVESALATVINAQTMLVASGTSVIEFMGSSSAAHLRAGETMLGLLDRTVGSLMMVNPVLEQIGKSALAITLNDGNRASALIDMAGGTEAFISKAATYYDLFFSASEKTQSLSDGVTASLATVDFALPTSREGFRALVEVLDLTTVAGQEAFTVLMNAAPAFDALVKALKPLNEMSGYDQFAAKYYTASEQQALQLAKLADVFTRLNVAMPTTTEGFRALVESYGAQGVAGQDAAQTLLNISGEFYNFTDAVTTTGEAITTAGDAMADAAQQISEAGMSVGDIGQQGISMADAFKASLAGLTTGMDFKDALALQISEIGKQAQYYTARTGATGDGYGGTMLDGRYYKPGELNAIQGQFSAILGTMSGDMAEFVTYSAMYSSGVAEQLVALNNWKEQQATTMLFNEPLLAQLEESYKRQFEAIIKGTGGGTGGGNTSVTTNDALSKLLHNTLGTMMGNALPSLQRDQAKAQIETALAIAKASGVLPTADSIRDALSTVSKLSSDKFTSAQDMNREYLRTMASVGELSQIVDTPIADKQLAVQEAMLAELQTISGSQGAETPTGLIFRPTTTTTNGSSDELIAVLKEKLQALTDEVAGMRSEQKQLGIGQATTNTKVARIIDKWDALGVEI